MWRKEILAWQEQTPWKIWAWLGALTKIRSFCLQDQVLHLSEANKCLLLLTIAFSSLLSLQACHGFQDSFKTLHVLFPLPRMVFPAPPLGSHSFFLLYPAHIGISLWSLPYPHQSSLSSFIPLRCSLRGLKKINTHTQMNKIKDRLDLVWPRKGEAIWGHGKDEPRLVVGMNVGLACLWHGTEISLVVWEYRGLCLAL